jgi:hypothetical protein
MKGIAVLFVLIGTVPVFALVAAYVAARGPLTMNWPWFVFMSSPFALVFGTGIYLWRMKQPK